MVPFAVYVIKIKGLFVGFEYGLKLPLFRSRVTSKKLATFLFASIVILSSFSSNIFLNFLCLLEGFIQYCKPVVPVEADIDRGQVPSSAVIEVAAD